MSIVQQSSCITETGLHEPLRCKYNILQGRMQSWLSNATSIHIHAVFHCTCTCIYLGIGDICILVIIASRITEGSGGGLLRGNISGGPHRGLWLVKNSSWVCHCFFREGTDYGPHVKRGSLRGCAQRGPHRGSLRECTHPSPHWGSLTDRRHV